MCDNCKQAAYELELQWGAGHFDYPKLLGILKRDAEQDT